MKKEVRNGAELDFNHIIPLLHYYRSLTGVDDYRRVKSKLN